MQHGKFTKMRRKITPGTRKSRKIKLYVYQKKERLHVKLCERFDIWSLLLDPQFSVPDSRFSNLDFRFSNLDFRFSNLESRSSIRDSRPSIFDPWFSIFDLRSVILDPWFPKVLGSRIEFRVETVINYRIPQRNKLHLG